MPPCARRVEIDMRVDLTVWNGLAQGCLRLSMENGRVLAPFLYAWVSEDECAPDL